MGEPDTVACSYNPSYLTAMAAELGDGNWGSWHAHTGLTHTFEGELSWRTPACWGVMVEAIKSLAFCTTPSGFHKGRSGEVYVCSM